MKKMHTNVLMFLGASIVLGSVLGATVAANKTDKTSSTSEKPVPVIPIKEISYLANNSLDTNAPELVNTVNDTAAKSTALKPTVLDATDTNNIAVAAELLTDLSDPKKKDIAMQLVSSAENSTLDWKNQYSFIKDIDDGRGYTGGIIGFTSGTHDMLQVVQYYTKQQPDNILAKYIPALKKVDGSSSHDGLDPTFTADWKTAAADPKFRQAQDYERDLVYFNPAVKQGKADGLRALGQFIYYDALVMHGPGTDQASFGNIRTAALKKAKPPAQGGDEAAYLNAFLDARTAAMLTEAAHDDTSRVDTAQRVFLKAGNFDLNLPLAWKTYGDSYKISE